MLLNLKCALERSQFLFWAKQQQARQFCKVTACSWPCDKKAQPLPFQKEHWLRDIVPEDTGMSLFCSWRGRPGPPTPIPAPQTSFCPSVPKSNHTLVCCVLWGEGYTKCWETKPPILTAATLSPWHSQRYCPEQRGTNTRAFLPFVGQSCSSAQRSGTLEEGGMQPGKARNTLKPTLQEKAMTPPRREWSNLGEGHADTRNQEKKRSQFVF